MKALVLLEYHFIKNSDGRIYCDRVIDYNYMKRYLNVFDQVVLCGRTTYTEEDCENKLLVSGENIQFVPLPDFRGIKGLIKNYFKIIKIVKESIKKVDCCIMRAPNHLSLITYKLFKKNKLPFALEVNIAADKFIESKNIIGKILNKFVIRETKKMCLTANGVSYVTEHVLQDEYPCMAMKQPNNQNYFTASYSTIDLTDSMLYQQNWKLSNKPDKFRIVHTGYMDSYRKGHTILLKAIKILVDSGYCNIEVILVGDGVKRKEFENLANDLNISEYVNFIGLVKKKDDMTKILRNCHMLVFPTQSEGLPRSIIEAMAVGLVCISSPVDGIPELLDNDMMIDYNDANGYACKIIELMNDWPKMLEISKLNRVKVQKYKKENLNDIRKEFYNKLRGIGNGKIKQ